VSPGGFERDGAGSSIVDDDAPIVEKKAATAIDARHEPSTIVDKPGHGKTESETAIRQAIAAATIEGDDARADALRALLRGTPRLRRVK